MRLCAVTLAACLNAGLANGEEGKGAAETCDVAGEAGGWLPTSKAARAIKGELKKVGEAGCDIERRSFESLDVKTFGEKYMGVKPVILYHYPERVAAEKSDRGDVLQGDWNAEQVNTWLVGMGLTKVAQEAVRFTARPFSRSRAPFAAAARS